MAAVSSDSLLLFDPLSCLVLCKFFLGDYRPLIRDTNGHVLDQVGFKYLYLLFCF